MDTIHQDISTWKKLIGTAVVTEPGKLITIIPVESLAGAYPHQALLILGDGRHAAKTQSVINREGLAFRQPLGAERKCKEIQKQKGYPPV
jgi:hypothetical protein